MGHIDFGADPVGFGVYIGITLSCLHNILEPVVRFLPNFHGYIFGMEQRTD